MNYQITVDYGRHLVAIQMYGYEADTVKFFAEMQRAVLQAKSGGQHFDVLTDFTEMAGASPVMPRSIADESAEMNVWFEAQGLRKSATVLTSALFKMQLQRVTLKDQYAFFNNRIDADKWLSEA
jgi:hypothetical protein